MIRTWMLVLSLALGAAGCAGNGEGKDVHEACCTPDAENCDLGQCTEGLTCYVLPYGPYPQSGLCCASDTCIFACDPSECSQGWCQAGEARCPKELTCLNSGTPAGDVCLP
ncbi:MAG: hypothetical protein JRJ19_08795 [Deltaproteobacteria bacterium]|nr:hypothetical protein [Deltaproteobacteria bacterium]MBW1872148.1 hypothetical protein [Deltaproteobacteria bacterium]